MVFLPVHDAARAAPPRKAPPRERELGSASGAKYVTKVGMTSNDTPSSFHTGKLYTANATSSRVGRAFWKAWKSRSQLNEALPSTAGTILVRELSNVASTKRVSISAQAASNIFFTSPSTTTTSFRP